MAKKLLLFGVGIFCETLTSSLFDEQGRVPDVYTVDSMYCKENTFCGKPLIPFEDIIHYCPPEDYEFMVAIGYARLNRVREEKAALLRNKGYSQSSFVSKYARVASSAKIPAGSIIFENTVVHPFAKIGTDIIILPNVYVGHHSIIGKSCYIGPGACLCGGVSIGNYCFIGANATIREFVSVQDSCIIGAGSVLMRNLESKSLCNVGESTIIRDKAVQINLTNPNILREK